jgi:hypothetical protein
MRQFCVDCVYRSATLATGRIIQNHRFTANPEPFAAVARAVAMPSLVGHNGVLGQTDGG